MEKIKIPHTDLEVSRLTLGCMGLGGGWAAGAQLTTHHERQAREFLDAAEEIGANFFDHANIYGRGRAEEICGGARSCPDNFTSFILQQGGCHEILERYTSSLRRQSAGVRRLPVASDTSIAELHEILQSALDWTGEHLHRFLIHGAAYGIQCSGGIVFREDAFRNG